MKYVYYLVVAFIAGLVVGHFYFKPEAKTVTEVKREIKDIKTTRTTIKKPSGEIQTVIVRESHKDTVSDKQVKLESKKYHIQGLIGADYNNLSKGPIYGISGSMQVTGPFTAGIWVIPELQSGGATLGISF